MAARITRESLEHGALVVAPQLVGALLVVDGDTDAEVRARLVEVEAYLGEADPASHAYRGRTARSAVMFGEAGHLYVYFSYGMHHCANVVCGPRGSASAVLLRAAVVEAGEAVVRTRRGSACAAARLLSGPGNLCRGLGIDRGDNEADLLARHGRFRLDRSPGGVPLAVGPRVGISRAVDLPYRFTWAGHPAASHPRPAQKKGAGASAGP